MPFEPLELNITDLPQETQYRLAELEMLYAIRMLHARLFKKHGHGTQEKAINFLLDLMPNMSEDDKEDLQRSTKVYTFQNPSKDDLVLYFRFNNVSYGKITKMTGISPRTIALKRFDYAPRFPVWSGWNPLRLSSWNDLKTDFNLFNQPLYHAPDLKPSLRDEKFYL